MTDSQPVTAGISVGGPGGALSRIVIGGTKPADARSGVPTDLRMQTSTENKAGQLEATVLSDIGSGTTVSLVINGETVFTGEIQKSEPGVGDRTRITAFDTLHDLKNTFIDVAVDNAAPFSVIDDVASAAGVDVGFEPPTGDRTPITRTFTDARADSVLDTIQKITNTKSVVTPQGQFRIAPVDQLGNTEDRKLSQVVDVAAGSRRPPFNSVQVIGNSATPDQGEGVRHLLSTLPVVAEAGSGQPTFIFEDDSIASQAEANAIADSLLSRLQKQQQGGFVEIVGRPEIRPFDTIQLPDAQGGGRFLVDDVAHRLSGSEGFITRLSLAAPI
jgi:hypothetical protein